jgi:hypothetical protein
VYAEISLYPWKPANLIMVYDPKLSFAIIHWGNFWYLFIKETGL